MSTKRKVTSASSEDPFPSFPYFLLLKPLEVENYLHELLGLAVVETKNPLLDVAPPYTLSRAVIYSAIESNIWPKFITGHDVDILKGRTANQEAKVRITKAIHDFLKSKKVEKPSLPNRSDSDCSPRSLQKTSSPS